MCRQVCLIINVLHMLSETLLAVQFLWASDEIDSNSNAYWSRVMEIARVNTLTRQRNQQPLHFWVVVLILILV